MTEKLPVLHNIFNLFEDNVKEYIFNDYDRYTTKLDLVQESNGVRITLTDAVYDGENITIAYIIDSAHDLREEPLIYSEPYLFKELDVLSENQLIKKLGDHKYAGLSMLNILNGNRPDTIDFTWDATSIYSRFDNNIETKGNWSFEFTLDKVDSEVHQFKNVGTKGDGFEVKIKNITTTPISTSIYFIGKANIHAKEWIEENWITVFYDFEITDNLSNKYTVVSSSLYGGNIGGQHGRVITTEIDENATSITVTPIVTVFKEMENQNPSEPGVELESAKPPLSQLKYLLNSHRRL